MLGECSCNPPSFWDLGRNARDVYEQNYTCGILGFWGKMNSPLGVEFISIATHSMDTGKVEASLESSVDWPDWEANFKEKWCTDNTLSSDVFVKNLLIEGVSVGTGSQFSIETGKKKFYLKGGYSMNLCNIDLDIKIDPPSYMLRTSVVGSLLGWMAGVQVIADLAEKSIQSHSFALGYYAPGLILHSNVAEFKEFTASIYQRLSENLQSGILLGWSTDNTISNFGFGVIYNMDEETSFRGRFNNHTQFGMGMTHRLNQSFSINLATCIDGKNFTYGCHKIGIGLDLEDSCVCD